MNTIQMKELSCLRIGWCPPVSRRDTVFCFHSLLVIKHGYWIHVWCVHISKLLFVCMEESGIWITWLSPVAAQTFSISCSFFGKFGKIVCWRSLEGRRPLLRESWIRPYLVFITACQRNFWEGNIFSLVCLSTEGMWPLSMMHWTSLYSSSRSLISGGYGPKRVVRILLECFLVSCSFREILGFFIRSDFRNHHNLKFTGKGNFRWLAFATISMDHARSGTWLTDLTESLVVKYSIGQILNLGHLIWPYSSWGLPPRPPGFGALPSGKSWISYCFVAL